MSSALATPARDDASLNSVGYERGRVTANTKADNVRRIVVVGAGPVGLRFANEILKRSEGAVSVTLFGDEPYAPYDRIKLSELLAHGIDYSDIFISLPEFPSNLKPTSSFNYISAAVTDIDCDAKCVIDGSGVSHDFDELILAVGSKPHVPTIDGVDLKGVYTFRNIRDTEALLARNSRSRHTVVVGGGLLGLEVARALKRDFTEVTLVHQSPRLMNRQLDELPAAELLSRVQKRGIAVITQDGLVKVTGNVRVEGLMTRGGHRIFCDTVVLCTGIKPNTELALKAGIRINRGIVVDDELQTSKSNIFAIGECCEHRGNIYGLVAPGLEQAAVLAERLSGGPAIYSGSQPYTQLKVMGEAVNSMGEVTDLPPRPKQSVLTFKNRRSNNCRSVAVLKGRIIGACAVGEWPEAQRVREALLTRRYLFPWQRLWFLLTGRLWLGARQQHVAAWPASAVVCQCNQLQREVIDNAISIQCCTVKSVGQKCGAGMVCGSCQSMVAELIEAKLGSEASLIELDSANDSSGSGGRLPALLTFSVLTLLASLSLAVSPAVPSPVSVQVPSLSFLWTDAFWKQVSGFSLVGVTVVGLILSMRKRLRWSFLGAFTRWRLVHTVLGLAALSILLLHTGASMGENLNRYLMVNYLVAAAIGALLGIVIALNKPTPLLATVRSWGFWLHVLTLWPLPVLLSMHVLSSYYF